VCLSVCLSLLHSRTTAHNLGNGRGCPLVVQYWADLQSVHGFRCYDNTHVCKLIALYTANAYSAECKMQANACTRSMAGYHLHLSCKRLHTHIHSGSVAILLVNLGLLNQLPHWFCPSSCFEREPVQINDASLLQARCLSYLPANSVKALNNKWSQ